MAPRRFLPSHDMNLLTNSFGPAEGAIITILVMVVVICLVLYWGRRQEKKDLKAKSDSQADRPARKNWTIRSGFGDRPTDDHNHEDFEDEASTGKTPNNGAGDDWAPEYMAPHLRPGWNQAARAVNQMLVGPCQRQLNTHKHAELKETATRALQICLTKLAPDHFMTGLCLDWLSYAEQGLGNTYDALIHLESAAAILSEWPAYDAHCKNSILPRIAGCRQTLGFDQD